MGGKKLSTDEEVKEVTAELYEAGIEKRICRLTTCIERDGNYVE